MTALQVAREFDQELENANYHPLVGMFEDLYRTLSWRLTEDQIINVLREFKCKLQSRL